LPDIEHPSSDHVDVGELYRAHAFVLVRAIGQHWWRVAIPSADELSPSRNGRVLVAFGSISTDSAWTVGWDDVAVTLQIIAQAEGPVVLVGSINHADGTVAMDLFVVPTISFRLLYGLLIMCHGRRQILWFGVTAHPTAKWITNQLTEVWLGANPS
jgi:hypothetical protein